MRPSARSPTLPIIFSTLPGTRDRIVTPTSRSSSLSRRRLFPLACAALLLLGGCEFVMSFIAGDPADQLLEMVLATWATEGQPALGETRIGIATAVTGLGDGVWEIHVADESVLAGEVVWTLEIDAVKVYRVFPSPEFADFVNETAQALDRRAGLNSEARAIILDPSVAGVGEVHARYSRSDRGGGGEMAQRATYRVVEPGGDPEWVLDTATRTRSLLLQALELTVGAMARQDERVMRCAGSASYDQDPVIYRACAGDVLEEDFGSEDGS